MKATASEFSPGLVLWLDQQMLMDDPSVHETLPQPHGRVRPFVCVEVEGDRSTWTPLTSTHRPERLRIEHEWRSGGDQAWRQGETFLNDGANTYTGPNSSFVAASHAERTAPGSRARVSAAGLEAVRAEIRAQRGRQQDGAAASEQAPA